MQESDQHKRLAHQQPHPIVWFLALALIGVGASFALIVINEVVAAYLDWQANPFLASVVAYFDGKLIFEFNDQPLVLSKHGATIIAFIFAILFATLAIHIAFAFIFAGVKILSPTLDYQLGQLREQVNNLADKIKAKR